MKEKRINKKRIIILIVIALVLVIAGVLAFAFLTPKTIEGDWELIVNPETSDATPDEAASDGGKAYYTFSKPGEYGDGTYKTYYDGGVEEGTYKLSEKGGKKMIDMGTGELEYTITGSKLFGSGKLTIIYPEQIDELTGQTTPAQEYVFAPAKAPNYEKEAYDSFETDKALIAEWVTNERTLSYYIYELSYKETVKFRDSGIMTIRYESADLALDRTMYYAYTTEDNTLTFSLVTDKETTFTVRYAIDADGNLRFTEDNTSSSIFADAVFGDATYYTPDRLPEPQSEQAATIE